MTRVKGTYQHARHAGLAGHCIFWWGLAGVGRTSLSTVDLSMATVLFVRLQQGC